jgi:hypothetical protein
VQRDGHGCRQRARLRHVEWPGFDPATAVARIPSDAHLVVARPSRVTFEQALLHWERHTDVQAEGPELYQLGRAYLERARRSGSRADAEAARRYLERFAAGDVGDVDPSNLRALIDEARRSERR